VPAHASSSRRSHRTDHPSTMASPGSRTRNAGATDRCSLPPGPANLVRLDHVPRIWRVGSAGVHRRR
jgi:hypothetical protein